jgi:hypothetical protein
MTFTDIIHTFKSTEPSNLCTVLCVTTFTKTHAFNVPYNTELGSLVRKINEAE